MGQGHFARVFRRDVYGSAEPHRRPFPIRLAGWQETRGQATAAVGATPVRISRRGSGRQVVGLLFGLGMSASGFGQKTGSVLGHKVDYQHLVEYKIEPDH